MLITLLTTALLNVPSVTSAPTPLIPVLSPVHPLSTSMVILSVAFAFLCSIATEILRLERLTMQIIPPVLVW